MFKKFLSLFFTGLLVLAGNLQVVRGQSGTANSIERNRVERIKNKVYWEGTGRKSKIVVEMKNGRKLKGYISKIEEDSFNLTNSNTGRTTAVIYRDIARIKKQGMSQGAKFALGIGVVAVIVVLTAIKNRKKTSGFCPLGCGPF